MSESSQKAKKAGNKERPRSMDEILGPSQEQQAAAIHNRKHPELSAEFRQLTGIDARDYQAVKAWQQSHHLRGDGKIGAATLKAARGITPKQGGQAAEVEGEKSAKGAETQDATESDAQAADEGEQSAMDPSVAALFQDETKSTDQALGTEDKDVAQQANACRLALSKHLNDFRFASEVATKIALGDAAGMGKAPAKTDPYHTQLFCNLGKLGVQLAWKYCGGAGEVQEVLKMAKEELLGPMEGYADKAYEGIKGQIEKHATEVSLSEITMELASNVTINVNSMVDHAMASLNGADPKSLAQTWRLICGTVDTMTVHGDKLDGEQKGTVTTEMLEQMTGIIVSGSFAEQLANTLRQQALVTYASAMNNPGDRANATEAALAGNVPEQTKRIAHKTGDDQWMVQDKERREKVHE